MAKNIPETIYPAPHYPIYKAYYGVDGWFVMYLSDRYTARDVDGGKFYSTKQSAYRRAAKLNESLEPVRYYTRNVDAGSGRQNVIVKDGVITHQYLEARQGYYTGDGNPELVGQPVSALHGMGFRKVRGPQAFNSVTGKWSSLDEPMYPDED